MKKIILSLFAIIALGISVAFAQDQILIQEDFNGGPPAGWQSQPVLGNNQWNVTNNGGNNIDGSQMLYIQNTQNQASITELILPPIIPNPGIQSVVLEMDLQQLSENGSVLKVVLFEDQNPVPLELFAMQLQSCDPVLPWSCEIETLQVPIPNDIDASDQLVLVFEDLIPFNGLAICAIDNLSIFGFNDCPIGLEIVEIGAPSCHDGADAFVEVVGVLGIPPFIYTIDNGASNGSGFFTTTPGSHTITAVDLWGCESEINVVVPNAESIGIDVATFPPTCLGEDDAVINAAAVGGTPPYSYTLNDGPAQNNGDFSSSAGIQTISVTDDNGCTCRI